MYSYCCLCILIVRPCILNVVYVFLLFVHVFLTLSMYSHCCLCILIVFFLFLLLSMYSYYCLYILIFRPCILNVVYVYLLLSMYSYCCLCILIFVCVFLDAATLTEVFPCFFLGCKANARV